MPVASLLEKILCAPAWMIPTGQSCDNCHLANGRQLPLIKGKNVVSRLPVYLSFCLIVSCVCWRRVVLAYSRHSSDAGGQSCNHHSALPMHCSSGAADCEWQRRSQALH
eukprot:GHUV01055467.1.p1 GENE.GHUV01055467.1~~GHUV01055467.1.p1  ORF type:complete len:109 (-),score=10.09 GHUV01055467.1:232-558(-)